jgi:hypothetical protein
MQFLIIYDTTGFIISATSGNAREPEGLPFLYVDIPDGKYAAKVNVSAVPHEAVLYDTDFININTATLEEVKMYQVVKSRKALETYLVTNPILSTCHNPNGAYYAITEDKQRYLTQMIMITQLAIQAGQEYLPSWNATGEPCTYDWTLEQLQQLAFEIESVVRPKITAQQTMEAQINACITKDEVLLVSVIF